MKQKYKLEELESNQLNIFRSQNEKINGKNKNKWIQVFFSFFFISALIEGDTSVLTESLL